MILVGVLMLGILAGCLPPEKKNNDGQDMAATLLVYQLNEEQKEEESLKACDADANEVELNKEVSFSEENDKYSSNATLNVPDGATSITISNGSNYGGASLYVKIEGGNCREITFTDGDNQKSVSTYTSKTFELPVSEFKDGEHVQIGFSFGTLSSNDGWNFKVEFE